MPWRKCSVMEERMRFVIRLKDGESMTALCREFDISRKTGYKILERYEQCGVEGLSDRTRRPFRYANQLPEQIEAAIVAARREKPSWGAPKIRERLRRRLPEGGERTQGGGRGSPAAAGCGYGPTPSKSRPVALSTPCSIGMGW